MIAKRLKQIRVCMTRASLFRGRVNILEADMLLPTRPILQASLSARIDSVSEPQQSFVVLYHVSPADEHWDLMIETGQVLATWRLMSHPRELAVAGARIRCRRISDHRRDYLEYEGPLSGNRGDVTRVDRGECSIHDKSLNGWVVEFSGEILRGEYLIDALQPDREGEIRRET